MSSSSELQATRYLEALKALLKEREITYADLAEQLAFSLPTLKRALNKPSVPLSRLMELCDAAGIPFDLLHERAERLRPRHTVLTEAQDRLFFENEDTLAYFLELAREGRSPAEIADEHELDEASAEQYLERLCEVGLVRRREDGRVDVLVDPPFGFPPGSRVIRKRMRGFLQAVTERVIDSDLEDEDRAAIIKPLRLTRQDYGQLVAEITAVVDRFATIAGSRISREHGQEWMVAVACGPAPPAVAGDRRISPIDDDAGKPE